jgi:hypothetical protein
VGKKYRIKYNTKSGDENNRGFNYIFLLIFFGIVILIQIVGMIMRNFQVGLGQWIGIGIGLIGYILILNAYLKDKKKNRK